LGARDKARENHKSRDDYIIKIPDISHLLDTQQSDSRATRYYQQSSK
jgi:hypothetical protein